MKYKGNRSNMEKALYSMTAQSIYSLTQAELGIVPVLFSMTK